MRKQTLAVLTIALVVAGCSKNEITGVNVVGTNQNIISIEPSTGKVPRATDVKIAQMQADAAGFNVFATSKAGTVAYIDNKAYAYSIDKWSWFETTNIPQWPTLVSDYPLYFYAYYPADMLGVNKLTIADHEKSIAVGAVSAQKDLLSAASPAVRLKPSSSKITFTFAHLLSKIGFKAEVSTQAKAFIQALAINQVKDTRKFDFFTSTWSATNATNPASYIFRTSPTTGKDHFEIVGASPTITAITGDKINTAANAALMLMPQTYAPTDVWDENDAEGITNLATKSHIEMIYRMQESASPFANIVGYVDASKHPNYATSQLATALYTGGLHVKVAYGLQSAPWEKGKFYSYVFGLGTPGASGGYLIDDKFYDDNGNRTDLPTIHPGTGDPIDPLDPIFSAGGNIDFTVKVEDWETAEDQKQ